MINITPASFPEYFVVFLVLVILACQCNAFLLQAGRVQNRLPYAACYNVGETSTLSESSDSQLNISIAKNKYSQQKLGLIAVS